MKQLADIRSRKGDNEGAKAIQKITKAEANERDWKQYKRH
jgi:hypothetical protein